MNMTEVKQFLASLRDSFRELETLPIPTIAVIDGAALGGGLEMALCCDIRVGGGNKKVKIGLVETKLAIIPGYVFLSFYRFSAYLHKETDSLPFHVTFAP